MEFATGGDMFQLVVANRGLPEQDARWYFQQLIIAVDYCHKMVSLYTCTSIAAALEMQAELSTASVCEKGHEDLRHEPFEGKV